MNTIFWKGHGRRRMAAQWLRAAIVALTVSVVGVTGLVPFPPAAMADGRPPAEIDAPRIIEQLSNALSQGRDETARRLSALGFAAELDQLRRMDGSVLQSFSSQTMIEGLYRRAQATSPREGDRFLAKLVSDAGTTSAAIAADPQFAQLRNFKPEELARPIVFAPPSAVEDVNARRPLPAAAEKAIDILAAHYSGPYLARARGLFLSNFRKAGFDSRKFEEALAKSKNSGEAIRRLMDYGLPPPRAETALRNVLRDAREASAALGVDSNALAVMEDLSRDLPPELEQYLAVEDKLPSRALQYAEAKASGQPEKVDRSTDRAILDKLGSLPGAPGFTPSPPNPGNSGGPSNNPSAGGGPGRPGPGGFKPGPDRPATTTIVPPPTPSGPAGGGAAQQHAQAYSRYTSSTFEPIAPSPGRPRVTLSTPRNYRVAIASARAARGIAMGGIVRSEVSTTPVRATWLSNRKDDRFGRLFVEFPASNGQSITIGASRVFFSDSFLAAAAVLWGNHDAEATFREGEILVLMSMDPDSSVSRSPFAAVEAKAKAISDRMKSLNVISENDLAKLSPQELRWFITSAEELKVLEQRAEAAPRGIVTHPAIFGRELAWSAARVDFWFNRIGDLGKESAMINGGQDMPQNLRNLDISAAGTWQFYELDSVIRLGENDGKARRLSVMTKVPGRQQESLRSHFGVSMFALGKTPPRDGERVEDGVYRLPRLEREVQPMLDWLSTNHHDFMRLNDFSEAFSLLRWLKSKEVRINIIDIAGQRPQIATPDRVVIGKGPQVGRP